jgi:hypothetical protein
MLVAILWGFGAMLRRQNAIREDSPEFVKALSVVEPLLATRLITPRAIKAWQNRMRFIAERVSPEIREVDALDRFLHWVGNRVNRKWVPDEWFYPPPKPKPTESTLILLGAVEVVQPQVFQSPPEAVLSNFDAWIMAGGGERKNSYSAVWQQVRQEFRTGQSGSLLAWPDDDDIKRYIALPETARHGRNGTEKVSPVDNPSSSQPSLHREETQRSSRRSRRAPPAAN